MKKIYTAAWFLLITLFLVSVLVGNLNPLSLVAFSLLALALVYTLALWAVFTRTRHTEPAYLQKITS